MLTLPVEAGSAAANRPARILVIGRSETVLSETVTILREKGYAAGAASEFDRTLDLFDAGQLDLVVFGGMVPPDTKEHLREQLSARNPAAAFVQGYAGIPGLIAEQVEAALSKGTTGPAASVTFDARSRSIGLSLDGPQDVTVIAWWHTSFAPPGPKSTSRVILDEELPAARPAHAFIVGPMPSGTTMARFPDPSSQIGGDPPSSARRAAQPDWPPSPRLRSLVIRRSICAPPADQKSSRRTAAGARLSRALRVVDRTADSVTAPPVSPSGRCLCIATLVANVVRGHEKFPVVARSRSPFLAS